jgi:hypothetical protein
VLIAIVGVIAFLGGVMFQRIHSNNSYSAGSNFRYGVGQRGFMRGWYGMMGNQANRQGVSLGRGIVNGTISGINGNQITIKLPNGLARTIDLSSSTQYLQINPATQTTLIQGRNVTVTGQISQDGSVSAQTVSINPAQ